MIEALRSAVGQVLALGARYGVDPFVFAAIYIGAIPFFLVSSSFAIRRLRAGRPAAAWVVAAGLCFVSGYVYVAVAGHDIPAWVWALLTVLIGYSAWCTVRSGRRRLDGR